MAQIAAEKTDIVRPGGTLVVGAGLAPDALAVAQRVCAERGARLVAAPAPAPEDLPAAALGSFQRINFALARAAAAELLGDLDEDAVAAAAAQTTVPGRFEIVADDPLTIHDGAHNPDGIVALTGALGEFLAGRRLVCCLSVLDDKDAEAMLRELLPLCDHVVLTTCSHPRAVPAAQLLALCERIAGPPAVVVEGPKGALEHARELTGPDGVALATGSLYLIADLRRWSGAKGGSIL